MKILILFLLPFCLWAAYPPKNYHHFDFDEGSGEFLAENKEESFELPNETVDFHDEGSGDGEFPNDKTFRIQSHQQLEQGKAIPIVVPNSGAHNFSLDRHLLEQILLDEKVADKKVALIAVAGEYRKGKSFLLNFFLRYLAHHSAGDNNDSSMDWLDPNVPLANRFSFKRGTSTHTKGILLWSQPFLMRNLETGEEVAVLLMDTQGTFDDESSLQDNAIIFSLSTMLSSTMIYNIGGQIKSSDLQYLQFFAKYAELAINKNGTLGAEELFSPFQSLVFLVRDWANSQEMDFGFEGGQQLLAQHLTARESDTKEMRKLRADIRDKLFQTVLCFLMPYPGKIVAGHGKATFNGNLTEIDNDFMEQIRQFVPAIFSPELLIPKMVNNEYVTGRELAAFFQLYFDTFNNPSMPNLQTVYEVASKLQCQMLANRTYQMFEDSMEKFSSVSLFEDIGHFENIAKSEVFNKTRLMGSQEMIEECRQRLAFRMASIKAHYKAIYQQKIDQMREEEAERKREEQFKEQQLVKEELERENAEAIRQNLELQRKLEKERLEKKRLEAEAEEQRKRIQRIQEEKKCHTGKRTLGGGFIGGVIGFMLGGPVGAAIGATGGGFMGHASC